MAAPYAYAVPAARNEYHLGATIEGNDRALRDADSDFNSTPLGWSGGFNGGDDAGPCVVAQQGSFCYDIVELKWYVDKCAAAAGGSVVQ